MNTEEKTWPDFYPETLKEVSWVIDGKFAGPLAWYNRHLPFSAKGNGRFIKTMLLDWFYKNGCPSEVCEDWVQWVAGRVTVKMGWDDNTFTVTTKKQNKEHPEKAWFDEEEFFKMSKRVLGFDKKQAVTMLKSAMKWLMDSYSKMR